MHAAGHDNSRAGGVKLARLREYTLLPVCSFLASGRADVFTDFTRHVGAVFGSVNFCDSPHEPESYLMMNRSLGGLLGRTSEILSLMLEPKSPNQANK